MEPEPTGQKKQKPYNSYLRYSGLGFQFLLVIGVSAYAGYRLDSHLEWKFPVFTLLFSMVALGGMMYKLYKALSDL